MMIPESLMQWIESFLTNRYQRIKISHIKSDWLEVWGTVPQGTLMGVLCFICMINDLETECTTIKYVDDTTIYKISNNENDHSLQEAINRAATWSKENNMNINPTKSKELLISFAKTTPNLQDITIEGQAIENVQTCKLLGSL